MLQTHEIVRIRPGKVKHALHQSGPMMSAGAHTIDFSDHWPRQALNLEKHKGILSSGWGRMLRSPSTQ
jgi:hypothetical protein